MENDLLFYCSLVLTDDHSVGAYFVGDLEFAIVSITQLNSSLEIVNQAVAPTKCARSQTVDASSRSYYLDRSLF